MTIMKTLLSCCVIAAMSVFASGSQAVAQSNTLLLSTQMPADSPEGRVHAKFAELVDSYSEGDLEVKIFPNDQLGKLDSVLEQLTVGTVHIVAEGSGFLKKWVPEMNWVAAPFLFEDRDHWVRFMQGDLVKSWLSQVEDEVGIVAMGDATEMLRGPYRVLVSIKPIDGIEALNGLNLRLHSNKTQVEAWTYAGAAVKVLPWTEVYSSLQTGLVEAVNSPVTLVESNRFYEVAPHMHRTDEYFQSVAYMVNKTTWESLDDDQRDILMRAYQDAAAFSHEVINASADVTIESMQSQGGTFSILDRQPFVDRMRQFYEELGQKGELPEGFISAVESARGE